MNGGSFTNHKEVKDVRVRYHVLKGEDLTERQELNDDASLLAFLDESNQIEGECFVSDYTGIKILYNTYTGVVKAVSTSSAESVTFIYPTKSFNIIITPLKNIISLRNKRDFLLELCKLDVISISSLIKVHIDNDGHFTRKFTLYDVDSTLLRIQHLANRMQFSLLSRYDRSDYQHSVYEVLSKKEMTDIKTKKDAELIITMIKENQSKNGGEDKVTLEKLK